MKLADILKSDANALKLFSTAQIQQLENSLIADDKNEKFHLTCLRRNKKIQVYSPSKTNPEEIIRQLYILKLNQEYYYPIENMELEVPVQMGSASKSADIVIYDNTSKKDKENIVLIIEVKKPNESLIQGIDQLESYISALPTYLGVWVDGLEEHIQYRNPNNKYKFEAFKRLPIPKIGLATQTKISQLVQQSFTLKAESERLLSVAKRAVEMAIEQDEAAAMAYIYGQELQT